MNPVFVMLVAVVALAAVGTAEAYMGWYGYGGCGGYGMMYPGYGYWYYRQPPYQPTTPGISPAAPSPWW